MTRVRMKSKEDEGSRSGTFINRKEKILAYCRRGHWGWGRGKWGLSPIYLFLPAKSGGVEKASGKNRKIGLRPHFPRASMSPRRPRLQCTSKSLTRRSICSEIRGVNEATI